MLWCSAGNPPQPEVLADNQQQPGDTSVRKPSGGLQFQPLSDHSCVTGCEWGPLSRAQLTQNLEKECCSDWAYGVVGAGDPL